MTGKQALGLEDDEAGDAEAHRLRMLTPRPARH